MTSPGSNTWRNPARANPRIRFGRTPRKRLAPLVNACPTLCDPPVRHATMAQAKTRVPMASHERHIDWGEGVISERLSSPRAPALRAPGGQLQGATTMAYQQEAIRRGGATPEMAACRRNPRSDNRLGRSASHRLVARRRRTSAHQYVFLLTPYAARASAQRRLREVMKGALNLVRRRRCGRR